MSSEAAPPAAATTTTAATATATTTATASASTPAPALAVADNAVAAGTAQANDAYPPLRTVEEADAHIRALETEAAAIAKAHSNRQDAISKAIAVARVKRRRIEAETEGIYRFSDDSMKTVLAIDDVWRAIGVVNKPLHDSAECKTRDNCMNAGCRFKLEGVVPARHVPLFHVPIDAAHTFCLAVCEFCKPHAYALLCGTDYYYKHRDCWDGYGASTDFYEQPFCVMQHSRIASKKARDTLDRINERKRS